MTENKNDKSLTCNFCGKHREDVEKLIAGPGVYICNECISISYEIIEKENIGSIREFNFEELLTPKEIHAFLNEHIIGQEETKLILSTCAYNHYKRISSQVEIDKSNIMLVGPTGTGKTLFAKTLANILNVPFAIADATTLTEAGYVGEDVESVLERLLVLADYDVSLAEKGIVFIDEIDKKARKSESNSSTRDVGGEGVQQALLRLIEGTTTKVKLSSGKKLTDEYVEFDTSNVLFIVGGAFVGIEDTIQRRIKKKSSVGFNSKLIDKELRQEMLKYLRPDDLIKYGLIPELVGRLPVITTLSNLSADDMIKILTDVKNSIIIQNKELLGLDNLEVDFADAYYKSVVDLAKKEEMGARSLKNIVEQSLYWIMYHAHDLHERGINKIIFDNYPSKLEESKPLGVKENGEQERLIDYKFFKQITYEE
jgi:ATP-dependent Clp protease ATP-binding subunit ClpX